MADHHAHTVKNHVINMAQTRAQEELTTFNHKGKAHPHKEDPEETPLPAKEISQQPAKGNKPQDIAKKVIPIGKTGIPIGQFDGIHQGQPVEVP